MVLQMKLVVVVAQKKVHRRYATTGKNMMQICAAKQSLYLRPQKQRILHPEIRFTLSGDF